MRGQRLFPFLTHPCARDKPVVPVSGFLWSLHIFFWTIIATRGRHSGGDEPMASPREHLRQKASFMKMRLLKCEFPFEICPKFKKKLPVEPASKILKILTCIFPLFCPAPGLSENLWQDSPTANPRISARKKKKIMISANQPSSSHWERFR